MSEINSMEEAVSALQQGWDDANDNLTEQTKIADVAREMGSMIWMSHTTSEEVKTLIDGFTAPRLQRAFLGGLKEVIDARNNHDSMIAAALRPYVDNKLAELQAARKVTQPAP